MARWSEWVWEYGSTGVQNGDDLRFTPEEVLTRVNDYGDLAADLLTSDPPPLPDQP